MDPVSVFCRQLTSFPSSFLLKICCPFLTYFVDSALVQPLNLKLVKTQVFFSIYTFFLRQLHARLLVLSTSYTLFISTVRSVAQKFPLSSRCLYPTTYLIMTLDLSQRLFREPMPKTKHRLLLHKSASGFCLLNVSSIFSPITQPRCREYSSFLFLR
jgi:hypothetical protein